MRAVKIAQNIFVGCIFGRFVGCDWWDGAYKMTSFSWFHIWWFYWEQFEGIFFVSLAIKILLPFLVVNAVLLLNFIGNSIFLLFRIDVSIFFMDGTLLKGILRDSWFSVGQISLFYWPSHQIYINFAFKLPWNDK